MEAGLFFKGIVKKIKEEKTKKNKHFQILSCLVEGPNFVKIERIKNFTGEAFEVGQEIEVPVFISARAYNDKAYVDLVLA